MANDFDWSNAEDAEDIIMHSVQAVAVYLNAKGEVVIRQERDWSQDEDSFVHIPLQNIDALIAKLKEVSLSATNDNAG